MGGAFYSEWLDLIGNFNAPQSRAVKVLRKRVEVVGSSGRKKQFEGFACWPLPDVADIAAALNRQIGIEIRLRPSYCTAGFLR
jgi:hypothetical protein